MTECGIGYTGEPGIPEVMKDLAEYLKKIVDENDESKYLEAILLNYSFIENILKYALFLKITSDYALEQSAAGKEPDTNSEKYGDQMKLFCNRISFYQAQNFALAKGIIDVELFEKIDKIRTNRNDTVHQIWLYSRRKNAHEMRTELDTTIGVTIDLGIISTDLIKKIGIPEICEIDFFFPFRGKKK